MQDSESSRLAHALRNHLNGIAMNAELAKLELASVLQEQATKPSQGQLRECLEYILSGCRESAALLDQLDRQGADEQNT